MTAHKTWPVSIPSVKTHAPEVAGLADSVLSKGITLFAHAHRVLWVTLLIGVFWIKDPHPDPTHATHHPVGETHCVPFWTEVLFVNV